MDFSKLNTIEVADLAAELQQPWEWSEAEAANAVKLAKLDSDIGFYRTGSIRTLEDLRARPEAVRHLSRLPEIGESYHAVISGKYALWDLVPAILERIAPQTIEHLFIATLSFSKANAAEIITLLDNGKIKRMGLLVSDYFKKTNQDIYNTLVPEMVKRGHKVQAMRTHAKIILIETSRGDKYAIESSANARSCKNVEQFCLTRDDALHDFHKAWIAELIEGKGIDGWK